MADFNNREYVTVSGSCAVALQVDFAAQNAGAIPERLMLIASANAIVESSEQTSVVVSGCLAAECCWLEEWVK